ncbi:MAG TPA: PadR family transcriptional regulator [Streptosporangiaceae bacterium]|nr:PadR family transcriptional regulator [Streptosporangiaceae bacterium]
MPAPRWRVGDFDPGLFDAVNCAGEMLGHLRKAAFWMAAGPGRKGGPWVRGGFTGPGGGGDFGPKGGFGGPRGGGPRGGFGGPKGGQWGGSGGPWGSWWPGPPGSPGTGRGRKAGRGDVRAAILALLREGPRTGYQIMSDIEERSSGAWRPSPGAVYPALSQLADEGLIAGEESAGRRAFTLTDAGREYVEQNPDRARGAWESTAQQEAWELPGLFAEAARLGGGIVQIAHAGTPEQVQAAERLLEQTRRKLYQILADDSGDDQDDQDDEDEDDDEHEEPLGGHHGHE